MRSELYTYRDEQGTELFDLPDIPLPTTNASAPPRFLPEFDNLLLAYVNRSRIIPAPFHSSVFLTVGRVRATFLVDGFVAGTWKVQRAKEIAKLIVEPFELLSKSIRSELLIEGERLIHFLENDAKSFEVQFA
ncbi:hypothetical protein KTT_04250 [Tengunoibacter tsumagoiensis]|uniref:Winged helix DNA-binding domain-containing protein n=2 Tax=Tengunoibacter tsumagoiensis TaxID=2014871 RepID=A0A401ZUU9_9CHLR|nr:hypothetical protein KTT_04250 [Tengunoibacter tsumagoiensis]